MSQQGVYGDNLEICAFAREYDCDVKIYQREFAYVVSGGDDAASERKMLHIAYHTWEHYSSIRNIAGPHTGPPEVKPVLDPTAAAAVAEEEKKKSGKKGGKYVLPWMVDTVMRSLASPPTEEEIVKALEECKGDVNKVVGILLDKEAGVDYGGSGDEEEQANDPKPNKDSSSAPEETTIPEQKPLTPPPTPKPGKQKGGKNPHTQQKGTTESSITTSNTDPNTSAKNKPKRETARERKERQKAEAAERKRNKVSGGAKGSSSKGKSGEDSSKQTNTVEGAIRELYI